MKSPLPLPFDPFMKNASALEIYSTVHVRSAYRELSINPNKEMKSTAAPSFERRGEAFCILGVGVGVMWVWKPLLITNYSKTNHSQIL